MILSHLNTINFLTQKTPVAKIAKIRLWNHPADIGKVKTSATVTCTRHGLRSIAKTRADIAGNIQIKITCSISANYVYIFCNFRNGMVNF